MGELEHLRKQFDQSEAGRRELEKRVKEAGTMQQRLLMACTVGYVHSFIHCTSVLHRTACLQHAPDVHHLAPVLPRPCCCSVATSCT